MSATTLNNQELFDLIENLLPLIYSGQELKAEQDYLKNLPKKVKQKYAEEFLRDIIER